VEIWAGILGSVMEGPFRVSEGVTGIKLSENVFLHPLQMFFFVSFG